MGTFVIASVLKQYVAEKIDRRAIITSPHKELSEMGAIVLMRDGKINKAVGLVLKTVRHIEGEDGDYQEVVEPPLD